MKFMWKGAASNAGDCGVLYRTSASYAIRGRRVDGHAGGSSGMFAEGKTPYLCPQMYRSAQGFFPLTCLLASSLGRQPSNNRTSVRVEPEPGRTNCDISKRAVLALCGILNAFKCARVLRGLISRHGQA